MSFSVCPRKIEGKTYSRVTIEMPHKSTKSIANIIELVCNHPRCITEETNDGVICRTTLETKISNTIVLTFSNPPVLINDEYRVTGDIIEVYNRLYKASGKFVDILHDPEVRSTLSYGRTDQILKLSMYVTVDGWELSEHTYFNEVPRQLYDYSTVLIGGLWYVIHDANAYREHSARPTNTVKDAIGMRDHVLHTIPGTKDVELWGDSYTPVAATFRLVEE